MLFSFDIFKKKYYVISLDCIFRPDKNFLGTVAEQGAAPLKHTQKLCTGGILCRLKVTDLGVFNGSSGDRINPSDLDNMVAEKAREFGTDRTFKAVVDHFKAQVEDQCSRIDQHMGRVTLCDEILRQGHCTKEECEE